MHETRFENKPAGQPAGILCLFSRTLLALLLSHPGYVDKPNMLVCGTESLQLTAESLRQEIS